MWVWHDLELGDDYVIMGTTHGSSFVRITDPQNPEVIGILRTQSVEILRSFTCLMASWNLFEALHLQTGAT